MAIISRFFNDLSVPSTGLEIENILTPLNTVRNANVSNNNNKPRSGYVDQIIISETAGSATSMDIHIRYKSGISSRSQLVYLYTEASLPNFVKSHINAPYSIRSPNNTNDLYLYLLPNENCTLDIRIDFLVDD